MPKTKNAAGEVDALRKAVEALRVEQEKVMAAAKKAEDFLKNNLDGESLKEAILENPAVQETGRVAKEFAGEVEKVTRERPAMALLGSFAAGVVIGFILRR